VPVVTFWYSAFGAYFEINLSALNVWNLTASTPHSFATSTIFFASTGSPL